MGCSASKLDSDQVVARCRDRKHYIKLAVTHRHAFAAAHAAYMQSLKNTGAAIRQFGEGEVKDIHEAAIPPDNSNPPYLQPPPLPHFLAKPRKAVALGRASSLPPMRIPIASTLAAASHSPSMTSSKVVKEDDEEEDDEQTVTSSSSAAAAATSVAVSKKAASAEAKPPPPLPDEPQVPPPPPPPAASRWEIFNVFPASESAEQDMKSEGQTHELPPHEDTLDEHPQDAEEHPVIEEMDGHAASDTPPKGKAEGGKNFIDVLRELDEQFLRAFENGKEVSRLLEARKVHYHSNIADFNGTLDHSSRVLRVMSWGRHPNMALTNGEPFNLFESGEKETHASTLDKLLAWEKKLHDEVKAGEIIRSELERKSAQLKSQKKREVDPVTLNKTKSVVKSLHTRWLVEFQAVNAASMEVQKLRDDSLHTQMVDLAKEQMNMWNALLGCHNQQYQLIEDMESLDNSYAPAFTTDFHARNTEQLEAEINLWHQNFDRLIISQKDYVNAVYQWLLLHIIQIESDGKDAPGSPKKMSTPPVFELYKAWLNALELLPGSVPLHAFKAFSGIIHELTLQQAEELKQKKRLEILKKELEKKEQALKAQEIKYGERHAVQLTPEDKDALAPGTGNPLQEKEYTVKMLREKVEAETDKYNKLCSKSGSMTLTSLQTGLPPVLNAIKEFARSCSQCYSKLYTLALTEDVSKLRISY